MANATAEPTELGDVMLVDVMCPSKMIWLYRYYMDEPVLGCCSLVALGAVNDIGYINDMVNTFGGLESFRRDIWDAVPLTVYQSEKHRNLCVDANFGNL